MEVKCFECAALIVASDSDATGRLTGGTERLPEIGSVEVHHVTQDRVADWLRFFDHDGFAGNPDWASCYCLEPHVLAPPDLPERPWRDTRATMEGRLREGKTVGYLAYVEGRPAGWVNASLRSEYGLFRSGATVSPRLCSIA